MKHVQLHQQEEKKKKSVKQKDQISSTEAKTLTAVHPQILRLPSTFPPYSD